MGLIRPTRRLQPVALTLAGSDSGGNAGMQADLRVFHDFGVHGCTAITALTAQNPDGVRAVQAVSPAFLRAQLAAIFEVYDVRAIKTGMLHNARLIEAAALFLRKHPAIPLVVDPVMVATSGARLLENNAVATLVRRLLPLATLITPNIPEAEVLLGYALPDPLAAGEAARVLAERFGCAVLVKGGHGSRKDQACDWLCIGKRLYQVRTAVVRQPLSLHGTGCTLSAAITAALATGAPLTNAVAAGKAYVYDAIRSGCRVGPQAAVLGQVRRIQSSRACCARLLRLQTGA